MANNNSGRDKNEKDLVCSFCGKHQDEVERMIIGPGVNICSECIGLCADLLSDKPDHPGSNSSRPSRGSASRARIQPADDLAINIKTLSDVPAFLPHWLCLGSHIGSTLHDPHQFHLGEKHGSLFRTVQRHDLCSPNSRGLSRWFSATMVRR